MKTVTLSVGKNFTIRANKKIVDIETTDKQWKVQFGSRTKEYALVMYIINTNDHQALEGLTLRLFQTRLILIDTDFSNMFGELLIKFHEKRQEEKTEINKEEDDKIIEEIKTLHNNDE